MNTVKDDAMIIIRESISAVLPEKAVMNVLNKSDLKNDIILIAIGKAAWNMTKAATEALGEKVKKGIVLTKYGHSKGAIERCEILEAGHPVPDINSILGTEKVLEMVSDLTADDQVLLLVSGGGSALFEKPLEGVSLEDIIGITNLLLGNGADINEINTIRKHLSAVKGGRFARLCGAADIFAIVLSDVVGDKLDTIASGPAYPDFTTSEDAFRILRKYNIRIRNNLVKALDLETPDVILNCKTIVSGNVAALCDAAAKNAQILGYAPLILSTSVDCEAKEMGRFLASIVREIKIDGNNEFVPKPPCAIIAGGETVVRLNGNGKGGRNQEIALSSAIGIEGIEDVVVFSLGSDGTDGPTDAAGGIVDGKSVARIRACNIFPEISLANNDSYHALKSVGDLIITGPTGTNVNDLMVILCR